MAAAGRRPHDTPEPSVLAADLLAEQVPPAPADQPSYRAVPAAAAAAAAASAPVGDAEAEADADAGANAPTPAGDAEADAEAEASRPKQPSDLLTPEEVAALLESDL
jgi:hypothetical protein